MQKDMTTRAILIPPTRGSGVRGAGSEPGLRCALPVRDPRFPVPGTDSSHDDRHRQARPGEA